MPQPPDRMLDFPRNGVATRDRNHARRGGIRGLALILLGSAVLEPMAIAATITNKNPKTGLDTWKNQKGGFSLSLQQLTPNNVRAMYEAMGAKPVVVNRIAAYCVFGTEAQNQSHRPVRYDVSTWRAVTADGKLHHLRSKTGWQKIWKTDGVDYGFSILPAQQTFQPGDWGEGFTTVKLPHGTKFTLVYHWSEGGKIRTGALTNVRCAADR
ncbi:MAG: hypothetical protein PHT60_04775 [Acidiphilium sp.]|nr:hypothetical protein [Acidiphilium sp.]MDD4935076.1 hypothetical protein [Acidiphilium sp.]